MQFRLVNLLFVTLTLTISLSSVAAAGERSFRPESVAQKAIELADEFSARGLKLGSPVFLRVYKESSEMELWVLQGPRYVLFKTYGICRWSGGLGPKMYEGDRQSPEGLYHITSSDLIVNPRWDRAMNINYPNSFDLLNGRSGSSILIHGKCSSIGCFAIRDENVEEVYGAVRAALQNGQASIPVLSLPFRFAAVAPSKEDTRDMNEFWADLRRGDLLFNRDRLPPAAWVCDGRYYFADRRGDSHRHTVHLPGCKPLDEPVSAVETAELRKSLVDTASNAHETPKQAVEKSARSCDPKSVKCRLLRIAVKSSAICPKKYARCRTARAAYTKSVDCPLKYPRCRWFVGPDPKRTKVTHRGNIIRVRR